MELLLKISPKAQEDLDGIYSYVLKDGENIAKKQITVILDTLEGLKTFPEMGVSLSNKVSFKTDYRFLVVKKVYIVFYKINKDFVGIYRVFRTEQDYLKILDF